MKGGAIEFAYGMDVRMKEKESRMTLRSRGQSNCMNHRFADENCRPRQVCALHVQGRTRRPVSELRGRW